MASEEPLLNMEDIQGNVLEGFNKPWQYLAGLWILDVPKAKAWLRELAESITTLREVRDYKIAHLRGARRGSSTPPPACWLSVAFSWDGIKKLAKVSGQGFDRAFVQGQWRRSISHLGDPAGPKRPGWIGEWKVGGSNAKTPDIFLIVAADRKADLDRRVAAMLASLPKSGLEKRYDDPGGDLPARLGLQGHEHFGFKDNLSRPRVRGRVSDKPGDFFAARMPGIPQSPALPEFARPGEPLVWPGQFVLGYPTQSKTDPRLSNPSLPLAPAWLKDGSYLVFRRLRQDVALFRRFVSDQTRTLRKRLALRGLTEEKFAAMLIGRWKSGAPLSLSPAKDDIKLAQSLVANDFLYLGTPWPTSHPSPPDFEGLRCPVSAHIRKVNPRDQGTDFGPPADNLRRLMLRRGIPYGPALSAGEENDPKKAGVDRGLLFLSYQSSITASFEAIMQGWANSTAGPTPPPGYDVLLGSNPGPGHERFALLKFPRAEASVVTSSAFVYATGGGYFFTPSISAIRQHLAGPGI